MPSGAAASRLEGAPGWPSGIRRLWVRLNATKFDRALAGGANPRESIELSLRAGQLVSEQERERIAVSIEGLLRLIAGGNQVYLGRTRIPVDRGRIRANRAQFERLAEILRSGRYLSPRGVAMARLLMTDFRGPLYTGGRAGRLPEALAATFSAL